MKGKGGHAGAQTRSSRVIGVRALLCGALLYCGALGGLASPGVSSPGTGFTGDYWYRIVNGSYTVVGPGGGEVTGEHHSYGFNSTTNISQSNNGFVRAFVVNQSGGNVVAADAFGYNLARACVHGSYPNCVDTDGWTGYARTENRSNINLRLKGHGVY